MVYPQAESQQQYQQSVVCSAILALQITHTEYKDSGGTHLAQQVISTRRLQDIPVTSRDPLASICSITVVKSCAGAYACCP